MTKFLIIGDLHGAMPKLFFKKNDFDAIIAPGDFCSDAPRKYMFQSLKLWLEKKIDIEWYEIVGRKKALKMFKKSLKDGRKVLEYLNSFGKPVFITPGNWDWTAHEEEKLKVLEKDNYQWLINGLKNINDLHLKSKKYKNFVFIGHGITSGPEHPKFTKKKKLDKDDIKKAKNYYKKMKKLSRLFKNTKNKTVIFMTHNVPYNTKLDMITLKNSPRYGQHFGSVIAREIIMRYKPLVSIGGHMHEHFGMIKMAKGKTTVINAGFGGEVNCLLDIDDDKGRIKNIKFVNKDKRKEINARVG